MCEQTIAEKQASFDTERKRAIRFICEDTFKAQLRGITNHVGFSHPPIVYDNRDLYKVFNLERTINES